MSDTALTHFLAELSTDLGQPSFIWQLVVLVFCFALAWAVSHYFKRYFVTVDRHTGLKKIGLVSFSRVLFPLLALLLIIGARFILNRSQHTALLTIFIPIVASFALMRFGFYVLRRIFAKNGNLGTGLLLLEKIFATVVFFGVILHITGLWTDLITTLDGVVLPVQSKISLLEVIQGFISVVLAVMFSLWLSAIMEARLMLLPTMHLSLKVVLSRLSKVLFIILAILVSLSLVGIDLTVLSVFGGALGVGLGFGMQKIASNYVSGFIILFDRSMSIGDLLTVDQYSGVITQINTRYSVLKALDGVETIIPNEMLISSPVQNLSFTDKAIAINTSVSVAYKTDIDHLFPLLIEAITKIERISKRHETTVNLMKFGADGLELRIGFWIEDPENGRVGVTSDVNRAIWRVLQEEHVGVPYPQREVRFLNDPLSASMQSMPPSIVE